MIEAIYQCVGEILILILEDIVEAALGKKRKKKGAIAMNDNTKSQDILKPPSNLLMPLAQEQTTVLKLDECIKFLQNSGFKELPEERSLTDKQLYFTKDGLLVGLHECLKYEVLIDRVNNIHFSAKMRGKCDDLIDFCKCNHLSGFYPHTRLCEDSVVFWEMQMDLHPMHGFESFKAVVKNSFKYVQKERLIKMWSDVYLCSKEWVL
jgi:hypothetical protein